MQTLEKEWEEIHSGRQWGKWPRDSLMYFLATLPEIDNHNTKVLDLGCGNGASIWPFAWKGFDCYGIDISASAIKKTGEFLKPITRNLPNLVVGSIINLPYKDNTFDIVTDTCTVQHIPYPELPEVIKEIARVIKPGGIFFSVYRAKKSWMENNAPHVYTLDRKEIKELLIPYFDILTIENEGWTYCDEQVPIIHYVIKVKKRGEH